MAKQKHGHSDYSNSPRSQRRQRRQQQHSTSLACPSSSVLSILATIAAGSHTVDGSPLPLPTPPPPFLCPSINYDSFQPRAPTPTTASSSSILYPTSSLSSSSLLGSRSNRQLADKYVQDADGLWRETDAWTLFGSSVSFSSHHYQSFCLMCFSSAVRHLLSLPSIPPPPYNQTNSTLSFPLVGTHQVHPPTGQNPSLSCHLP